MRVLEIENLTKEFSKNGKKFKAVNDISFHINQGECCGLVGNREVARVPLQKW